MNAEEHYSSIIRPLEPIIENALSVIHKRIDGEILPLSTDIYVDNLPQNDKGLHVFISELFSSLKEEGFCAEIENCILMDEDSRENIFVGFSMCINYLEGRPVK